MRKTIILPITIGLSLVLVMAWFYLSLPQPPQYETLLYGKFKLSPKGPSANIMDWLSYEFTISERTELAIEIEELEERGSIIWHLYNATKETVANTIGATNIDSILLLIRKNLHFTVLLNETGDYTFALITQDRTNTVLLDLSIRPLK